MKLAALEKLRARIRENRLLRVSVIAFLAALALYLAAGSLLPDGADDPAPVAAAAQADPAQELAGQLQQLLGQLQGVGEVRVLLTLEREQQTVYQLDRSTSQSDGARSEQEQTVLSGGQGLVQTAYAPVWRGAIVACEGAGRASVELAVKTAVASVTGLGHDRIAVIKLEK